jgi:hypothetical protein
MTVLAGVNAAVPPLLSAPSWGSITDEFSRVYRRAVSVSYVAALANQIWPCVACENAVRAPYHETVAASGDGLVLGLPFSASSADGGPVDVAAPRRSVWPGG